MAYSAVPRAYAEPERRPLVRLDRRSPGRWTGLLTLRWELLDPLVVGAGRLTLHEEPPPKRPMRRIAGRLVPVESLDDPRPGKEVVLDVVRRGGVAPVLPGSSIKGAVRQVFELLTPSCDLMSRDRCTIKDHRSQVCPACSFFGGLGLAGRVSFLEATLVQGRPAILTVPEGWGKQKGEPGTVRVYDAQRAAERQSGPRRSAEKTWAIQPQAVFASRVRVLDASDEELGVLFASLGLGCERGPSLRLGGRKYNGFGGVRSRLAAVQPAPAADPATWALALCDRALSPPERRAAFDRLHQALIQRATDE